MPTAKSKLTIECTDTTSGVASPASSKYAILYRCQCRAAPRQPIAKKPYNARTKRFRARSRMLAKSGISPTNQNRNDTVAYVLTAKTSHTNGLRHCGQSFIVSGYGK